jgi:glutamate/tyrosine decarboxylase-like PLP-dependent enzyme
VHCGALIFVAVFSFTGSWLLYKFTDFIIPLRVSEEQEEIGLDLSQHGEVMHDMTVAAADHRVFAKTALETIEPYPFGNGHPRFWGWVNSPPAVMGVFADALAAAMNPSCAGGNHAAIYVEHQVLAWFREMLGFPATSMGLLVGGGSMATMTARRN